MMRLCQLCCHRDLLPIDWQDMNLNDIEDMVKLLAEGMSFFDHEQALLVLGTQKFRKWMTFVKILQKSLEYLSSLTLKLSWRNEML